MAFPLMCSTRVVLADGVPVDVLHQDGALHGVAKILRPAVLEVAGDAPVDEPRLRL